MKKQYSYVGLIPRLFSFNLDMFIFAMIITPISNYINKPIFLKKVQNYSKVYLKVNMDSNNVPNLLDPMELQKFLLSSDYLSYFLQVNLILIVMLSIYFVNLWIWFDTTPGKFIMGMRIVDNTTFSKPTKLQYIKRFCGYALGVFSLFVIPFSKQCQGFHDKIACTTVIKR